MWEKLPKKHRRNFTLVSFVYVPIGLALGLAIIFLITKFVFPETSIGAAIFTVISTVFICAILVFTYYRQLVKREVEDENKPDSAE